MPLTKRLIELTLIFIASILLAYPLGNLYQRYAVPTGDWLAIDSYHLIPGFFAGLVTTTSFLAGFKQHWTYLFTTMLVICIHIWTDSPYELKLSLAASCIGLIAGQLVRRITRPPLNIPR